VSTHALCPRCGRVVALADGGALVPHVSELAAKTGRRSSGPNRKARRCEGSGLQPGNLDPRRT
jgi:hypothetical protein